MIRCGRDSETWMYSHTKSPLLPRLTAVPVDAALLPQLLLQLRATQALQLPVRKVRLGQALDAVPDRISLAPDKVITHLGVGEDEGAGIEGGQGNPRPGHADIKAVRGGRRSDTHYLLEILPEPRFAVECVVIGRQDGDFIRLAVGELRALDLGE